MSDREYILRVALDVIGDQQAYTKVHSDKEDLVYLWVLMTVFLRLFRQCRIEQ